VVLKLAKKKKKILILPPEACRGSPSTLAPFELLITEFIKDVSPLLPNPCHFQDYDRSMLSSNRLECSIRGLQPSRILDETLRFWCILSVQTNWVEGFGVSPPERQTLHSLFRYSLAYSTSELPFRIAARDLLKIQPSSADGSRRAS